MKKRSKRGMSAHEFEAVRPLLNISEERIEAARLALVDGQTLQGVANIYNWSRQSVDDAVGVVCRTLEKYHEAQQAEAKARPVPRGWVAVSFIAPRVLVAKFRADIEAFVASKSAASNGKAQTSK